MKWMLILLFSGVTSMAAMAMGGDPGRDNKEAGQTLYSFQLTSERQSWFPLNDDVMGGRSISFARFTRQNTLSFEGRLVYERQQGFASIRSQSEPFDVSAAKYIKLRVRGDGRRYLINISSSSFIADPGYQADFETIAGKWQEVSIPLENFKPAFDSQYSKDTLNLAAIKTIGVIITNQSSGDFKLEVDWIKAI